MKLSRKIKMSHHEFTKKRISTWPKSVCIFCKKKPWCTMKFLQTCKKNLFLSFKKRETTSLFFLLWIMRFFQENKGKKNTIFIFKLQKFSILCIKKKVFLQIYTSTSTFTKLAWNCPQFHGSFTETDLKLKKRPKFHWNWVPKICRFWHEIS